MEPIILNGSNPGGETQRWEHPEKQVLIDIEYDAKGVAKITREGLTALLIAAGWWRRA